MKKHHAVLFDFDGTLSPTVEDVARAWVAVLARYGIAITSQDYYPLEGTNMQEIAEMFFRRAGKHIPDARAVVIEKEQEQLSYVSGFRLYPGVPELLDRLAEAGVPRAIVTASSRMKLQQLVPAEFLKRFSALVAGEDIQEGKPSPAGYLAAAERLGVPASSCIVVENAPLGVTAAKRAGMYCLALAHTLPPQQLSGADEILGTFEQLEKSPTIRAMLL